MRILAVVALMIAPVRQTDELEWVVSGGRESSSMYLNTYTDEPSYELHCRDYPPEYWLELLPPKASIVPRRGAPVRGTLRVGNLKERSVDWTRWWTDLDRDEVVELRAAVGRFRTTIEWSDGTLYRYDGPSSETFDPAFDELSEACEQHLKRKHQEFEVAGIQVELDIELEPGDLDDIRALAIRFGIDRPEQIFVGFDGIPVSILKARVIGGETRSEREVAHPTLSVEHVDWNRYRDDAVVVVQGDWQASASDYYPGRRFIVRDGSWAMEVRVGSEIAYEAAESILKAIRHGALIETREWAQSLWAKPIPRPEILDDIPNDLHPYISRVEGSIERYIVNLPMSYGHGTRLTVKRNGDAVELEEIDSWIV